MDISLLEKCAATSAASESNFILQEIPVEQLAVARVNTQIVKDRLDGLEVPLAIPKMTTLLTKDKVPVCNILVISMEYYSNYIEIVIKN
ncbi:hypothetical protein AAES_147869 [Amazona aestiva]|uniref:Uncharacterized protein n=1 Tax=Amazona aestiva TaxID=12930 RepID=A0A0Q3PFL9_AMAAE|nr:hypothetical protein AAES_147869 [Amazona aestiva]